MADRILDALRTPFEILGIDTLSAVTASIGIAEGDRTTPEELLQDADIALYRAKATGKRHAVIFSPSMQKDVDDHRNLDLDLRQAITNDEVLLLYQPIVALSTGAVIGVEALLRWRHPQRGVIQPAEFIPLLESSGLIIPVGRWVLEGCVPARFTLAQSGPSVDGVSQPCRRATRTRPGRRRRPGRPHGLRLRPGHVDPGTDRDHLDA